jgi:hypothetical protein
MSTAAAWSRLPAFGVPLGRFRSKIRAPSSGVGAPTSDRETRQLGHRPLCPRAGGNTGRQETQPPGTKLDGPPRLRPARHHGDSPRLAA